MSKTYTVKRYDRLTWISKAFYGTENYAQLIVEANPQLQGRGISLENYPIIYTNDVLTIPDIIENKPSTVKNDDNKISILIDKKLFSFFTEYKMSFSIDSFSTFSFSAPFDESLEIYRESFRPFAYKECVIFYGNEKKLTGVLLAPQTASYPDRKELNITGYSKPCLLNDTMMPISSFPLEFNNQDLQQITNKLIKSFSVRSIFNVSAGNVFEKVSFESEQNILNFLIDLAKKRGILISDDENGNMIFWKTNTGNTIASFKEGELPFISCAPTFDYQSFFSHITGVTSTKETQNSSQYTYVNKYLTKKGITRIHNFVAEDAKDGDIKSVVLAKAGRMIGSSASYELTVQGHKDRKGNLYQKNTRVTLHAPGAMVFKETEFLIKNIEMSRSLGGDVTTLSLVLPGAYSGEIPEAFPWEG